MQGSRIPALRCKCCNRLASAVVRARGNADVPRGAAGDSLLRVAREGILRRYRARGARERRRRVDASALLGVRHRSGGKKD